MELDRAIAIVGKIRIDRRKENEKQKTKNRKQRTENKEQKIKNRKTEEAGVDYEK